MKKILVFALVAVFALSGLVFAETDRDYDSNEGNVKQVGDWNIATIDQYGVINLADVNQTGNLNSASVFQEDYQAQNIVTTLVEQNGSFNQANVWQNNSVSDNVARPRTVTVFQDGNYNTASAVQNFGGYMGALIDQSGEWNDALQWQSHETGKGWEVARITQTGTSNKAFQTQLGVNGNLWASINQNGSDNLAIEVQSRFVEQEYREDFSKRQL